MKEIIFLAFLLFSSNVFAADEWSTADRARLAAALTLHFIDWKQTLYGAEHPDRFAETNQFLGPDPSQKRINSHFITTAALNVLVVHYLPSRYRSTYQYLWIAVGGSYVYNNYKVHNSYKVGYRYEF